jgi:hypothetical protein
MMVIEALSHPLHRAAYMSRHAVLHTARLHTCAQKGMNGSAAAWRVALGARAHPGSPAGAAGAGTNSGADKSGIMVITFLTARATGGVDGRPG